MHGRSSNLYARQTVSKKDKPQPKPKSPPKHHPFTWRHKGLFIAVFCLLLGNLLLWGNFSLQRLHAGKFPPATTLHGLSLSGLTVAQAQTKLTPLYETLLTRPISLHFETHTFQPTLRDLGLTIDTNATVATTFETQNKRTLWQQIGSLLLPNRSTSGGLVYSQSEKALADYLHQIRKQLPQESVDLSFDFQDNTLIVTPAITAVAFDINEATQTLREIDPLHPPTAITIPVTTSAPRITTNAQAAAAQTLLEKVLAQPLTIEIDEIRVELSPQELFNSAIIAERDGQLYVTFDESAIKDHVTKIAKQVDIKPVTRKVFSHDNSVLVEGRDGRKVNVTETTQAILERLTTGTTNAPLIIAAQKINRAVLHESAEYELGRTEGKYIDVDLSLQKLNILEGNTHIRSFSVSTGSWSTPTPIGEFVILNHIQTAWSKRYKLYMPFWMAIKPASGAYDGYGLHGLPYWPSGKVEGTNHLGRAVSHGCIRLGPGDAEIVYTWAENGTKVFIHQ